MNYHWDWTIFLTPSPNGVENYLQLLLSGLGWTLATAFSAWIIALLLGTFVGVLRTLPNTTLARISHAYVEFFRNIPLLVQLFLGFFVLPELLPTAWGDWLKHMPYASFITAVVCLGFFTSARIAEQVRAGIEAIPQGQSLAATALGLTRLQAYQHILLPQAFRIILPPLTSELLNIIKNSAVAMTIGLVELTASARVLQEFTFQVFEAFTAATALYMIVNLFVVWGMRTIEHKFALKNKE